MSDWPRIHPPPSSDAGAGAPAPLRGLSVILTRPVGSGADEDATAVLHMSAPTAAPSWAEALAAAGAEVIETPAIELARLNEPSPDDCAATLRDLDARRGWLILPSPAAVRFFIELLERLGLRATALAGLRLAMVGPAEAEQLTAAGFCIGFIAPEPRGASLAAALPAETGEPILIAGSQKTRPELRAGLESRGLQVRVMPLYTPLPSSGGLAAIREALGAAPARCHKRLVVVTSPSAVDAILDSIEAVDGKRPAPAGWVAIGPTTAQRLTERSVPVAMVAIVPAPTLAGLIEVLTRLASTAAIPPQGPNP